MASGHLERRGKNWRIVIELGRDDDGKRDRLFRTTKGLTKPEAKSEMIKWLAEIESGTYVEPSTIKLKDFLHQWLEGKKANVTATTYEKYRVHIDDYIVPALGKTLLSKLTPLALDNFKNEIMATLAPKSVHNILVMFNQALKRAVGLRIIPSNPIEPVERPRMNKPKIIVLNAKELNHLLDTAKNSDIYPFVYLLAATGLRLGEVMGLQWDHVDLKKGIIKVRQQRNSSNEIMDLKTPSSRRNIGIHKNDVAVIESIKKESDFLFPHSSTYYTDRFIEIRKKAGFSLRPHDLRHTHASLLLASREPLTNVANRLGHANPSITARIYAHFIPSEVHSPANTFHQILDTGHPTATQDTQTA